MASFIKLGSLWNDRLERARPLHTPAMVIVAFASLLVVACGGGGGSVPHPPPPSITPLAAATSVPFSTVGTPLALPGVGGYGESITIPANNQSATTNTLAVTISVTPVSGFPTLQSLSRRPLVAKSRTSRPLAITPTGGTGLLYFALGATVAVNFSLPAFTITMPAAANPALNYYLALYDPNNATVGWQTFAQLSPAGSTLTFSGVVIPFSMSSNATYGVAVYSAPACVAPCSTNSISIPLSATGTPMALPPVGGYGESITLPANDQSGTTNTLSVTVSTQPLAGFPTLQSISRKPTVLKPLGARPYAITPTGGTGLLYFGLSTPVVTNFSTLPAFTVTLPAPANSGLNYYLALYDPNNQGVGWQTYGQFSPSGSTLTFPGAAFLFTMTAISQYGFAVYSAPKCVPPCLTAAISIPFSAVGTPIALPGVGAYNESITLPPNDHSGTTFTLNVTISTQPLSGLPTLQSVARQPAVVRHLGSRLMAISPSLGTAILYFRLDTAAVTNFTSLPALDITLPAPHDPTLNYYLALYDPNNAAFGWQTYGKFSATGSSLTFAGLAIPFTVVGNNGMAVYSAPATCAHKCVTAEYPVPTAASGANDIITGPDGNLWFSEGSANNIGRITTSGSITEFPTTSSGPINIATGPAGSADLWFVTQSSIGKITTSGSTTDFPLATGSCGLRCVFFNTPYGIAAGPDGNLWFTEQQTNKTCHPIFHSCRFTYTFVSRIGRITPSGTITLFQTPTSPVTPNRITAGPDGNLWFTEQSGNNIGRITTSGAITEFPIPTAGTWPDHITTGPDGNLWFTEYFGPAIGRVTTSGAITEFPVATSGKSNPNGIAKGPDGNLWFTENAANKIGRITPAGTITEFPLPAVDGPIGIVTGPDGNLWFIESNANQVAKFTL